MGLLEKSISLHNSQPATPWHDTIYIALLLSWRHNPSTSTKEILELAEGFARSLSPADGPEAEYQGGLALQEGGGGSVDGCTGYWKHDYCKDPIYPL